MDQGVPRGRRARPVGDAPVDRLLERVDAIAKGWLIAMVEQTPLQYAASVLAADLAGIGPRICDAAIRALASDSDLRRLESGGALEPLVARAGELAGVAGAAGASGAIDALHGVLWGAVRDELNHPEPEQISELAQRLELVTQLLRGAALRRHDGERIQPGPRAAANGAPHEQERPPPAAPAPPASPASEPGPVPERRIAVVPEPAAAAERLNEALWVGAFEEEISRSQRSGAPLSLLLIELEDGDRMHAIEQPAVASATLGRFAQAVRDAVRRPDIIASESDTRAWVIARETGRPGAQALASRLGSAVREAEPWRGAPLTVSIGIGVLGEDGRDVDSLIEAAEESRFAAAASGVDVVRGPGDDDESRGENGAP